MFSTFVFSTSVTTTPVNGTVNGWIESASFAQPAPAVMRNLDCYLAVHRRRALAAGFPLSLLHKVLLRPQRLYFPTLYLSDNKG